MKQLPYTLTLIVLLSTTCLAQKPTDAAPEQRSFCDDGPDDLSIKPVDLPSSVLTVVMNTEQGRDAKKWATHVHPIEMLKGTQIHPSDSGGSFFLVVGSGAMSGADNTWFWIVRQNGQKASMLLFAGGNCLDLGTKKTLGYRNVVTTWSSPSETVTTTYAYNGKEYKMLRKRSHPNGER